MSFHTFMALRYYYRQDDVKVTVCLYFTVSMQ